MSRSIIRANTSSQGDLTREGVARPRPCGSVWCRTQFTGTHTGNLHFGRVVPPTGVTVLGCPEVMSLTFNDA